MTRLRRRCVAALATVLSISLLGVVFASPVDAADSGKRSVKKANAYSGDMPPTAVLVRGRGNGHGRGLSQFGAYGWATAYGRSWQEILTFYYVNGTNNSISTLQPSDPSPEIRVRLVTFDGRNQMAMISRTGQLSVNGQGPYGALVLREVSRNRYDIYAAAAANCSYETGVPSGFQLIASSIEAPTVTVPSSATSSGTAANDLIGLCEPPTRAIPQGRLRYYRGSIQAINDADGANRVVNQVNIEEYLRGVVPRESPATWGTAANGAGMNALRAQAVAARTYALAQNRYSYARTCDTTSCQVYGGAALHTIGDGPQVIEHPLTDTAIADTRGVVIRSGTGTLVSTEYTSSNGGRTAAGNFKAQQELISKVYPQYGKLKAFHVFGAMPANQRSTQMREFAESKGLMTNARCLTEGVDLPSIDCVVFTDPKKSKVDIVQAAGRALRLSPGKKFGYILIPLLIPKNENVLEAAKDTAFEEIVATIRALAIQDSRIIEYLRAVSSGAVPKGGSPIDGITKINVLTKVDEEEFNKSIQLKVWDRVAFGNWRPYEEAKKYVHSLKIKGVDEWRKYTRSKKLPIDIPLSPDKVYKKQFEGFGIFLGTGYIANALRKYRSYDDAKKYAKSLNLMTTTEWENYTKLKDFPKDIPVNIGQVYQKEFEGMPIFLGTELVAYELAKKFAISHQIKNQREWRKLFNQKKLPVGFPSTPNQRYKEWKGWYDFLETKRIYKNYVEAKEFALKNKIKTQYEWYQWSKSKKIPSYFPSRPEDYYKKEWTHWKDFLNTERKFKSYIEASNYAKKK